MLTALGLIRRSELELVFPSKTSKPLDRANQSNRVFFSAIKIARLRRIRFYDLRHSYAAILISSAENIKRIQKQLGHSSIQVTMDIHGHLLPETERDAPERLEAAFRTKTGVIV